MIRIETADGEIDVPKNYVAYMPTLYNMSQETGNNEVPITNISTKTMEKILEWIQYQSEKGMTSQKLAESKVSADYKPDQFMEGWFKNLGRIEQFKVMLAANYLEMTYLLSLLAWNIAQQIKGKTPEEINETYYSNEPVGVL